MFSITLRFSTPTVDDIVKLHVYEAPSVDGVFTEIEVTADVGTYPNYIDRFTTVQAVSQTDWFAIAWEDAAGNISDLSIPVQAGTETLVGEIVDQVRFRQPSIQENVISLEALAAIEAVYPTEDPAVKLKDDVNYRTLSGLVLLTQARALMISQSSASQWTAGIVSMKSDSGTTVSLDRIDRMLNQAASLLGLSYSVILQLAELPVAGGYRQLIGVDLSRSIYEIQ